MNIIEVKQLTVDYGDDRGIFDLTFHLKKGEVLGFLGPNGAGKTTTIRHLMGFSRPDKGSCHILGKDPMKEARSVQKHIGYLPGEPAFMNNMDGLEFIQFISEMKGIKNSNRSKELCAYFELNPNLKIKKMSKGMKQKIGLICAFMQESDLLILDEPTSGLDPLMQKKFIKLIQEEKKKGTTILMSSHLLEEIERTCDRVVIIKKGKLVAIENIKILKENQNKIFVLTFFNHETAEKFMIEPFELKVMNQTQINVTIQGDINPLIKVLANYSLANMELKAQTLENSFMHFYGEDSNV
ncbi:ABC-2 type transport system ATP-binding protein [Carnobacterium iners]|uniref:ABC-2 type transport system ATP-binding protein n=1 Tax=Carnobacterium iners TaxID=1073423 RepID=A0A1X7MS45_9LACT|nr:ABC transporter ATP-binding protein [Carnobacterium iners]SEL00241.1 ABC-2 type transport system ATP-binding protein [Carnobacterium iners]SMH27158.1 ABC-2 type transport system ATP-binding protein [Carnobacterium iners]